jgi:cytidylate kinase
VIIAIDGPSASGKGTIGRAVAERLGFHYLDTGALYRMVGLQVMRRGLDPTDEVACSKVAAQLQPSHFNDEELRGELVGGYASKVAVLPAVRIALLKLQRDFALKEPGAVLDGRDIGTVICPDADFKFYITASVEARSQRRHLEAPEIPLATIRADIEARDFRDATRLTAPLKPAADAVVIDTSEMGIEEAVEKVMGIIGKR